MAETSGEGFEYMTIKADAWCTVHYTTQDFTAISEVGQLHERLGSKSCHFKVLSLSPGPVYLGFGVGSGD